MELKTLKPKLGRWLSIEELSNFLVDMPEDVCSSIPINRKLLEISSEFVEERRGGWEHPDWEDYLDRLLQEGYHLSDDTRAPIGSILEIFKEYYHNNSFQAIVEKRRKAGAQNRNRTVKNRSRKSKTA